MLNRTILPLKWLSLVILVIGIALVQLPNIGAGSAFNIAASGNPALGLSAVVAACFMSGFAGVYFEKMLKGTPTSVWMRNIQMGTIGGILALAAVFIKDGQAVLSAGFFQGWNLFVWGVVTQVSLGGLIVALVVRYADNILKGFATSLSIIASGIISMYMVPALKFFPTTAWFVGTSLVLAATILYSLPDERKNKGKEA
uniref:Uncharacterized protein n=1 Tax=Guillardia theta TaxID=55529 RepID=A0A7S4NTJ3_GUITH